MTARILPFTRQPESLDARRLPPHRQYWQPKPCVICGAPVYSEGGEWWDPNGRLHNLSCDPRSEA